jgi:hypothetical protein
VSFSDHPSGELAHAYPWRINAGKHNAGRRRTLSRIRGTAIPEGGELYFTNKIGKGYKVYSTEK